MTTFPDPRAPSTRSVTRVLADPPASDALGQALAGVLLDAFAEDGNATRTGFTIHFSGDLGAGKTTVVRALLRRLGVEGRIKSPTYTLVEPYVVQTAKSVESRERANLYCYHFDFYRFEDPHEWLDAGFRDYFSDAALRLVEWPERALSEGGSLLPPPDLHVTLSSTDDDGRVATLSAGTDQGDRWLSRAASEGPTATGTDRCAADC